MEHSSHAHPLPNEHDDSPNGSSAPSYASCTISSPPTSTSPQTNYSPNQQTRRLQLRNTGFRAPILPFRRISPLLGASANGIEPFTRPVNTEGSPSSAEKRATYGEDLPQSPVNILQEIHKISTRKKRTSPRPGFGAIFEDNTRNESTNETSWYNGGSNDCSPNTPAMTPVRMTHLREISLNRPTPPPMSSPLVKHVRSRNTNRGKLRSASSEAARYIEHLESELASAHARLDLQTSPKTSKLRAARLRTLTTENRDLKSELSEWQKNFESRVQEERNKHLDADLELRTGMRMLEDEMEMKDARMAELEWELDSMRVRMRDLEGLEAINHNLEKRIEALTNLLVQSPNKLELSSASTSPVRTDPSKRVSRPRSMFPRVPQSPGGLRTPLATVSEASLGHPRNLVNSPDNVESPEEITKQSVREEDVQSPDYEEDRNFRSSRRQSGSEDRRSRASFSHRSTLSPPSKHTSLRSSCSFGPMSWGLPDQEHSPATKQRRMRRFPSGSNSLKPLILPSTTEVLSTPASEAALDPSNHVPGRGVSDTSLDPTSGFLSPLEDDSTPEPPERYRSASWAQEQTLKALEGRVDNVHDLSRDSPQMSQSPPTRTDEHDIGYREISTGSQRRLSRPRSLQKELEEAGLEENREGQAEASPLEDFEDGMVPVRGDQTVIPRDPLPGRQLLRATHRQQQRQALDIDRTPRPVLNQLPLGYVTPQSGKTMPSTALSDKHAHGIFYRLTNVITKTKQDPFILARRLLANAWAAGSKRLGGMGWWLLGLVYGARWRKRKRKADIETAEDGGSTASDFDWQHFSAQASRSRVAEHYFRDDGAAHTNRESWLSPPHMSRVAPPVAPTSHTRREPHLFPCDDCVEPSSRRTFRLWLQFSLTIILAVGMAVKHGPGALLTTDDGYRTLPKHAPGREREPLLGNQRHRRHAQNCARHASDEHSQPSGHSHDTNGVDSGYGSITFAETLGPADFEA